MKITKKLIVITLFTHFLKTQKFLILLPNILESIKIKKPFFKCFNYILSKNPNLYIDATNAFFLSLKSNQELLLYYRKFINKCLGYKVHNLYFSFLTFSYKFLNLSTRMGFIFSLKNFYFYFLSFIYYFKNGIKLL